MVVNDVSIWSLTQESSVTLLVLELSIMLLENNDSTGFTYECHLQP